MWPAIIKSLLYGRYALDGSKDYDLYSCSCIVEKIISKTLEKMYKTTTIDEDGFKSTGTFSSEHLKTAMLIIAMISDCNLERGEKISGDVYECREIIDTMNDKIFVYLTKMFLHYGPKTSKIAKY